jgi:hypothetical protein
MVNKTAKVFRKKGRKTLKRGGGNSNSNSTNNGTPNSNGNATPVRAANGNSVDTIPRNGLNPFIRAGLNAMNEDVERRFINKRTAQLANARTEQRRSAAAVRDFHIADGRNVEAATAAGNRVPLPSTQNARLRAVAAQTGLQTMARSNTRRIREVRNFVSRVRNAIPNYVNRNNALAYNKLRIDTVPFTNNAVLPPSHDRIDPEVQEAMRALVVNALYNDATRGVAIRAIEAVANRRYEIDPESREALQKMMTTALNNETTRELAERVIKEAADRTMAIDTDRAIKLMIARALDNEATRGVVERVLQSIRNRHP